MESVVLDPLWFDAGHTRAFRQGIVDELCRRGATVEIHCHDVDTPYRWEVERVQLPKLNRNHVLRGLFVLTRGIRVSPSAAQTVRLDLAADRSSLWGLALRGRWVRVLHGLPIGETHGSGRVARVRDCLSTARARIEVLALRVASWRGHAFVVHSELARCALQELGVTSHVVPLPSLMIWGESDSRQIPQFEPPYVLIIGPPTARKSVSACLRALDNAHFPMAIWVTGCTPDQRSALASDFPNLQLTTVGHLTDRDYRDAICGASAVIVLNDKRFDRSMATSAVLIDAVTQSVPVVAHEGMAASVCVPGRVIEVDRDDEPSVVTGIQAALKLTPAEPESLARLRTTHSFEHYVDALIALGN